MSKAQKNCNCDWSVVAYVKTEIVDALSKAIERVKAVHKEVLCECASCKDNDLEMICWMCHDDYPCMTIMAINGELDEA
jgi:hypothetical protein